MNGQCYNNISDADFLKLMTIYKTICYGPVYNLPVHDIEICKKYIELFADTTDVYNDIDKFLKFCASHNINTTNDLNSIIVDHINDKYTYIASINNYIKNNVLPTPKIKIPNENKFVKLIPGHTYLSIDLVHAFSQFVDSLKILPDKYDTILIDSIPFEYLKKSKRLRMFMYFQCEQLYNITSFFGNDYIINLLLSTIDKDYELFNKIRVNNLFPQSYNLDEVVYDITGMENEFIGYIGKHTIDGVSINASLFIPHYVTYDDNVKENYVLIKTDYITGIDYIANRKCKYINQLYKAFKGLPITHDDLIYTDHTGKIYKLTEPVKITNIE